MFKKKYFIALFLISTFSILYAQPYYYTSTYEPIPGLARHSGDLYRINMSNPAVVESLMTNVYELTSTYSDEYGNWLAYEDNRRLFIMNLNNPTQNNIIENHSEGIYKFSYAEEVNRLIVLYEANPEKLVLVNPATLTITDTIPYDIHWEIFTDKDMSLSKIGDVMYLMKVDTSLHKEYIASYSLSSNQIIATKYIEELSETGEDEFFFNFRRNGSSVIESLFLLPTPTSYYRIYFMDKDSLSIPIVRDDSQTWADGYVTNEGKYLLLFNMVLNPDSIGQRATGRIEIYDMSDGELKKTIQLPSDGEVMCFENYPNNIYYAIDIEEPTRQIYTLKMDSIFNVLDLTSLSPSSKIVNSPPFTLTVNGHGFDTLCIVFFNGNARTTTYVNDSVLTASISTSDISVAGNYPVWVTDEWGISDTLNFAVTPQPAVLTSITPSISFPYTSEESLPIFTGTATGGYFTESSVVYFNGLAKTTSYISDSVITFEVNSSDIPVTGNYPVWVSNNNINSDTLIFSVVTTLPQQITPILECVRRNSSTSYTAYFGYNNYNNADVFIPYGTKNSISSGFSGASGSPVKIFFTGRQTNAFSINFYGDSITWILNGNSVTASKKSPACP